MTFSLPSKQSLLTSSSPSLSSPFSLALSPSCLQWFTILACQSFLGIYYDSPSTETHCEPLHHTFFRLWIFPSSPGAFHPCYKTISTAYLLSSASRPTIKYSLLQIRALILGLTRRTLSLSNREIPSYHLPGLFVSYRHINDKFPRTFDHFEVTFNQLSAITFRLMREICLRTSWLDLGILYWSFLFCDVFRYFFRDEKGMNEHSLFVCDVRPGQFLCCLRCIAPFLRDCTL